MPHNIAKAWPCNHPDAAVQMHAPSLPMHAPVFQPCALYGLSMVWQAEGSARARRPGQPSLHLEEDTWLTTEEAWEWGQGRGGTQRRGCRGVHQGDRGSQRGWGGQRGASVVWQADAAAPLVQKICMQGAHEGAGEELLDAGQWGHLRALQALECGLGLS